MFEETLILLSTGVNPEIFSWLDRPTHSFRPVLRKFEIWKLIDSSGKLTDSGREVQRCPLDLERAILFVELSKNGFQKEAARLIAFLETADFSKVSDEFSLERITLNDLGRRIENQLLSHRFFDIKESESFRNSLFKIFIHYFPEKMAQKKEGANGISSLGRGVQFSPHLISEDSNYFLLLNGRDISDAVTWVDFAISFSQKEFQTLSYDDQLTQTEYIIDFEKKTIYKQLKKSSGYFVVSTSAKTPLDPKLDVNAFREVFNQQIDALIEHHPHSKNYFTKINFLKNRKEILGYTELDFNFQKKLPELVLEALADSLKTLAEFLDYDLQSLLTYLTPDRLKKDLQKLHSNFTLPLGKIIPINYETELAPLISVRVQDALGLFKTPHLLDQRVSITIEFLAPNYRPAQITGDLENFWKLSYYEIRKEYRARYPRHDWPESPLDWKPEMSKRLKPKPR